MRIASLNVTSKEFTGEIVLPANVHRKYLFIVMTEGTEGTIELGGGGGKIPIETGFHFNPYPVPTSEVSIITDGKVVIISNDI